MHASLPVADSPRVPQEAPAIWLRRLWERMTALYGHAWVNVHGVTPHQSGNGALSMSGDTWSRTLSGLLAQQIGVGVEACIAEGAEWPPSAPRFRAMCLGIPSLAAVQLEINRDDRSAFTRAVWMKLDTFRYRQATADRAERMLQVAYGLVRDEVMRGGVLPAEPVAAIEHVEPVVTPATPNQVSAHLAHIAEMLKGGAA